MTASQSPDMAEPDDCPFAAIIRGEDPDAQVVAEAADWIAFFPNEPATPGHTLVIPRRHVRDVWDLDNYLAGELMRAVVVVGIAVRQALDPEGLNLISSAGKAAEQTVEHVHLHVVPRWHHDRIGRIWPPKRSMPDAKKEGLAAQIRETLGRILDSRSSDFR